MRSQLPSDPSIMLRLASISAYARMALCSCAADSAQMDLTIVSERSRTCAATAAVAAVGARLTGRGRRGRGGARDRPKRKGVISTPMPLRVDVPDASPSPQQSDPLEVGSTQRRLFTSPLSDFPSHNMQTRAEPTLCVMCELEFTVAGSSRTTPTDKRESP